MHTYSFEKLDVWQLSTELTTDVYLLTQNFPSDERFCLVSQLRRACNSISSNIVEGNARPSSKEKIRYIHIAYGSTMEVLNHLLISKRLKYITNLQLIELRKQIDEIANKLNGLKRYHEKNWK